MTNDPWDDERLDAAYSARGEGHPTPIDLTASTMAAIRSGARPATVSRWPRVLQPRRPWRSWSGAWPSQGWGRRD